MNLLAKYLPATVTYISIFQVGRARTSTHEGLPFLSDARPHAKHDTEEGMRGRGGSYFLHGGVRPIEVTTLIYRCRQVRSCCDRVLDACILRRKGKQVKSKLSSILSESDTFLLLLRFAFVCKPSVADIQIDPLSSFPWRVCEYCEYRVNTIVNTSGWRVNTVNTVTIVKKK